MKAITLTILLSLWVIAGCVDADDQQPKPYAKAVSSFDAEQPYTAARGPDTSRTVSYLSGKPWDGWRESPERVKVTVRSDGQRNTHYFESLPVAYGWLPERYDKFDIVEMLVANALTGNDLLDFDNAYFITSRSPGRSIPLVLAYPTRRDALVVVNRYPSRYSVVDWRDLDGRLDSWRADYWDDWRDDFGFVRTASVAHYDGAFWDGWYDTPDRVLVRVHQSGRPVSYYFDSLPVAWSWINSRPVGLNLLDLQVAASDGSLRLLPARSASYVWLPSGGDALPTALAFATLGEAQDYLHALGDRRDFHVTSWDDLKPRLTTWSDDHWNDWRGSPKHARGISRALEAGLGNKLGLRHREEGVVAGDHRVRERTLGNTNENRGTQGNSGGKAKGAAHSGAARHGKASGKHGGHSKHSKARGHSNVRHNSGVKQGKSGGHPSKTRGSSSSDHHNAKGHRNHGGKRGRGHDKSSGGTHGNGKQGGKK
jgi:hypothetical protein